MTVILDSFGGVFPTYVGMFLHQQNFPTNDSRIPYIRGDVSQRSLFP